MKVLATSLQGRILLDGRGIFDAVARLLNFESLRMTEVHGAFHQKQHDSIAEPWPDSQLAVVMLIPMREDTVVDCWNVFDRAWRKVRSTKILRGADSFRFDQATPPSSSHPASSVHTRNDALSIRDPVCSAIVTFGMASPAYSSSKSPHGSNI